jgi:hypothetical protein
MARTHLEWVEGRLAERVPVQVPELPKNAKGKVWSHKPKYPTLWAALGMTPPEEASRRSVQAEAERLADELAKSDRPIDWENPSAWGVRDDGGFPA